MKHNLQIDSLALQANFYNSYEQQRVVNKLANALLTTYSNIYIKYNTKAYRGLLAHKVYSGATKILEIKSGSYLTGRRKDKHRVLIYYICIEFAGLKRYDEEIDRLSLSCLKRVCAYLNTNNIKFEYTQLDICVDMYCRFNNTYAFCNKRASGVRYFTVKEIQPYSSTHYIEKYNHTHNQAMKRAYVYDKSKKEKDIAHTLTRFELKLQSRFFNRYPYYYGMLQEQIDRYHILYFKSLKQKALILDSYDKVEGRIRRRDIKKLNINEFRLHPNVDKIDDFLLELYDVYETNLVLPHKQLYSSYDWLDKELEEFDIGI